ncbi:MAG: hypothetical protein B6U77_02050 [Candidatus Hecatellales archaeon ex4484_218]|nr:MAG: hypothetical protein B6U77_02050 [Candidatus Hecatellales archaeon ex4484_218]
MGILCSNLNQIFGVKSLNIRLEGLCEKCGNDKCRRWLIRNLDGIEGKLVVSKCEFFVPKKDEEK